MNAQDPDRLDRIHADDDALDDRASDDGVPQSGLADDLRDWVAGR